MTKQYFIAFDYMNTRGLNKFMYSVVDLDIEKVSIRDVAIDLIKDKDFEAFSDDLVIRVNAFNNLD